VEEEVEGIDKVEKVEKIGLYKSENVDVGV
jgi:hypothetical protein